MKYASIHTHTVFSDGKQTPRENVEAALALGMEAIGFSDHSYTSHDHGYCMKKEREADYIREIRALKEEYRGRIDISLGLELDATTLGEYEREAYDYLLGDCHYVRTPGGYFSVDHAKDWHTALCENWFGGDYIAFARAYFEQYTAAMQEMKPHVLGHFDLVAKFCMIDESDPRYLRYAKEALEACLAVTPYIELNTGAIARGNRAVPYPAPYLLETVKEKGGKLLLGADSHDTALLTYGFRDALALLPANGIRTVCVIKDGKFEEREINL